jgi:hypothetical protein
MTLATEIAVVLATISQYLKHFPLALLAGTEGVDDKIGA